MANSQPNSGDPGEGRSEREIERELGVQPLDAVLLKHGLANHDVVDASVEQLTHKMVGKGRRGRRLTPNIKNKISRAVNSALLAKAFSSGENSTEGDSDTEPKEADLRIYHPKDLFNY